MLARLNLLSRPQTMTHVRRGLVLRNSLRNVLGDDAPGRILIDHSRIRKLGEVTVYPGYRDLFTRVAPLLQGTPPTTCTPSTLKNSVRQFTEAAGPLLEDARVNCHFSSWRAARLKEDSHFKIERWTDFFLYGPGVLLLRPSPRDSRLTVLDLSHLSALPTRPGLKPYGGHLVFDEAFNVVEQRGSDYHIASSAMTELIVAYHAGTIHLGETQVANAVSKLSKEHPLRLALEPFLVADPVATAAAAEVLIPEGRYFDQMFAWSPEVTQKYLAQAALRGYPQFSVCYEKCRRLSRSPLLKLPYYRVGKVIYDEILRYLEASIPKESFVEGLELSYLADYLTRTIWDHYFFSTIYYWQVDPSFSGPVISKDFDGCPAEYFTRMLPIMISTCFNVTSPLSSSALDLTKIEQVLTDCYGGTTNSKYRVRIENLRRRRDQ